MAADTACGRSASQRATAARKKSPPAQEAPNNNGAVARDRSASVAAHEAPVAAERPAKKPKTAGALSQTGAPVDWAAVTSAVAQILEPFVSLITPVDPMFVHNALADNYRIRIADGNDMHTLSRIVQETLLSLRNQRRMAEPPQSSAERVQKTKPSLPVPASAHQHAGGLPKPASKSRGPKTPEYVPPDTVDEPIEARKHTTLHGSPHAASGAKSSVSAPARPSAPATTGKPSKHEADHRGTQKPHVSATATAKSATKEQHHAPSGGAASGQRLPAAGTAQSRPATGPGKNAATAHPGRPASQPAHGLATVYRPNAALSSPSESESDTDADAPAQPPIATNPTHQDVGSGSESQETDASESSAEDNDNFLPSAASVTTKPGGHNLDHLAVSKIPAKRPGAP